MSQHYFHDINAGIGPSSWYYFKNTGEAHLIHNVQSNVVITACSPSGFSIYDEFDRIIRVSYAQPGDRICSKCENSPHSNQRILDWLRGKDRMTNFAHRHGSVDMDLADKPGRAAE
ncbi:MAG: hypothetical protein MPK62_00665 [Alphaproteobacteria bacterium]|nr:hypothetical protein [Alphaproteobacteria bacterium]MDA8029650.1 hypothetical protein [Alphaproteobacteria bacterium]